MGTKQMKELWRVVPAHIVSLSQTYNHENKGILISLPRSTVLDVIHSAVSLESPPDFVLGSDDDVDDAPATLCASGAHAAKKPKKNKKAKTSPPPPDAIDDEDGVDDDASSTSAGPSAEATDTDFDLNQPKQKKAKKDKAAKKHKSKKDKFSQE